MSDDLVKRYEAVLAKRNSIDKTHTELVSRKATLLEQKTQLLAKLKSEFNIDSLEQLKSEISNLEADLNTKITSMESNLAAISS